MTNDTHFFSAKLAEEIGIAGATILGNLAYLQVQHEYAGHAPFEYQGRWYVRHSYESLQQWHPYLSIDQLKRLMARLVDKGYVTKSHLGKPYDRTLYWSVDRAIVHSAKPHDGKGEIARSDSAKSHDVLQTDNKRQGEGKQPSRAKRFTPPSREDVEAYMVEKGASKSVARKESEKLIDHYGANGWRQSSGVTIKSWKHTASAWLRRRGDFGGKTEVSFI